MVGVRRTGRSSPCRAAWLTGAVLASIAGAAAQEQPPPFPRPSPPPAPSGPPLHLFDAVVLVVGDRLILNSEIERELQTRRENAAAEGGTLNPEDEPRIRQAILVKLAQEAGMAQASKLLAPDIRSRIDAGVEEMLRDYEAEEVKRAGGYDQFINELGVLGKSLEGVIDERRTRMRAAYAEQQIMSNRLRNEGALLVTPAEMKRFYDENIDQFTREHSVDLAVLALRVTDREAAMAQIQRVADAWRRPGRTAAQVVAEFPDLPLSDLGMETAVSNSAEDARRAWLKEFATTATADQVSEPQAIGSALWLIKAVRVQEASQEPFESQRVQSLIHHFLVQRRLETFRLRLLHRNQRSIQQITPRWIR